MPVVYTGGSVCGLCVLLPVGTMASNLEEWNVYVFTLASLCKIIYVLGDQDLLTGRDVTSLHAKIVRFYYFTP